MGKLDMAELSLPIKLGMKVKGRGAKLPKSLTYQLARNTLPAIPG